MKLLDCADFHPNCSARNQIVEANPDISGIGVILGFLSTTCVAFLIAFSVLFLDRYETIVTFFRRLFTKNKEVYAINPSGPYWRSPAFWSKVLSKNLLAFSDTQLLTGLAVQFTAMLKHCSLSIYHFQVVTELAFLTTVTHLLTVVALRNYFVKNRWINLPRIFFMLGNLALLGYTSFVSYSYDKAGLDLSSKLACFYKGDRPAFRAAFGGKWAALLIGAIGGHVTIIAAMYLLKEEHLEKGQWSFKWLGALLRTWIIAPVYAIYGIIMAGQGLTETQALGHPIVQIAGSEREWGFGQFLPVLLLALPLFAGWESFWEEKDEDRENRFGRYSHVLRSRTTSQLNMFELNKGTNTNLQASHSNSGPDAIERNIESNGLSPLHTPCYRSTSCVTLSPHPTPISSPHLPVPSPAASPLSRSRSPSRSEEQSR